MTELIKSPLFEEIRNYLKTADPEKQIFLYVPYIKTNSLEKLAENNQYNFLISSSLKGCGFKSMKSLYECKYYKPLISINLIN